VRKRTARGMGLLESKKKEKRGNVRAKHLLASLSVRNKKGLNKGNGRVIAEIEYAVLKTQRSNERSRLVCLLR